MDGIVTDPRGMLTVSVWCDGELVGQAHHLNGLQAVQEVSDEVQVLGSTVRMSFAFDPPLPTTLTPERLRRLRELVEVMRDDDDPNWVALARLYNELCSGQP